MRIIPFLLLFVSKLVFSQVVTINARILDNTSFPIAGVSVLILDTKEDIITYGITDEKGKVTLQFKTLSKEVIVKLSHIGFKTVKKKINNVNNSLEFILEEQRFKLDEIVIKNEQIRDTVRIATDSIGLTKRSTLRDILEKTEGFNVAENGGINFRGRKIEKILINKKEVFIKQNKIALDNLEYDIMEEVELINNYKDKFDIDFNNFTSSVLNINTKDKFKGVFKVFGESALGATKKFFLKLKGFYFSDKLNSFSTSNTNNIGDKEFDFTNISNSFKIKSTELFRNNFSPFFREDDLLKKSFNSNSSVILRKENTKSRLGFVAYYNNLNQEKNIFQTSQLEEDLIIREDSTTIANKGNSLITNFLYNKALNRSSVLSLRWDIIYSDMIKDNTTSILSFVPVLALNEQNNTVTRSLLSSAEVSFKKKLSSKVIFSSELEYDLENTSRDFVSNYIFDGKRDVVKQNFDLTNQSYNLNFNFDYRVNKYISLLLGSELVSLKDKVLNSKRLQRDVLLTNFILQARGQRKYLDYKLNFKKQIYIFNNQQERKFETDLSANYNLNENNNIYSSYIQNNSLTDLYRSIDTLYTSFNSNVLNKNGLTEKNLTTANTFSLGYEYNSIVKSESIKLNYSKSRLLNDFQTILRSSDNGVLSYNYMLIKQIDQHSASLSLGKSFYLTKKYHRLRIGGSIEKSQRKYPIVLSSDLFPQNAKTENFKYGITFGLKPKNVFFSEINFNYKNDNEKSFIEDLKLNEFDVFSKSLSINRKKDKNEIEMGIGMNTIKNENFRFEIPFLNVNANFELGKKLELIARGKYLFNLLDIGNINLTSLNVVSNGNIINSIYTRDNMNFLIIGINYKF